MNGKRPLIKSMIQLPAEKKKTLIDIVRTGAKKYGMHKLPFEDIIY